MTKAFLLEDGSNPNVIAQTPGIYHAPSSSLSYGVLRGLVAAGAAQLLGERYREDGQLEVAVEVSKMHRNVAGQIIIGGDFFASALRDYGDWQEKWWREAIQNAVDAGATEVDCVVTMLDEAGTPTANADLGRSVEVSCQDNGKGMDEDTLLNKFLVLGGTTKRTGETVGGFGKAKELLLLPWLRWHMHSQDMIVEGHGIQYDVKHTGVQRKGTGITVWMPMDKYTKAADAQSFIKKCWIPGVRFTVNGEVVRANQKVGQVVEEIPGKLSITFKKTSKEFSSATCLVRVKGLYMFDEYVSSDAKGVVIVEITGPSIEILTANRDGLREYDARRALQMFLNKLASDVKSTTKGARNVVQKKYKGTGKFESRASVERIEADMLMSMGSTEPLNSGPNKPLELTDDQLKAMLTVLADAGAKEYDDIEGASLDFRVQPSAAQAMLGIHVTGSAHVEAIARQLAWEPDFYVYNEVEEFHLPARFLPEKMTPALRKLARFWAEMCRFVLIQLGSNQRYGIGWHIDRMETGSGYTAASYVHDNDGHWLMLNPFVRGDIEKGETYSLTDKGHINHLYAMAVHECTHMADGIDRHNEAFSSALTYNVARTANRSRQIEAIRRAVVARGAEIGKLGELGKPEPTRRVAEPPQSHRALEVLYTRMKQRDLPHMSEMDAEQAASYALFGETNDHLPVAISYAQTRERVYRDYVERDGLTGYDKALDSWGAAVRILKALAESQKPAGPGGSNVKPYTRKELTDLFDSRNRELPYNRMSAEQAAAAMLAYHELSEGIVQAEAKATTFAGEADDARGHGDPSARERELAAYAWQDASFILKALAEREGADVLVHAGKQRASQIEQESIDDGWATPNRHRRAR
jgi:hypothetical protein